ncbi:hypothetical protein EsH8_VI_000805 [Colletotrichum jinshuiense]
MTRQPRTSSETTTGAFTVVTGVIGGAASTWTVIGGSTITGSFDTTTVTPVASGTVTGDVIVITSVVNGVGSTWTVIGGSTVTGSFDTTTATPAASETATDDVVVITSVVDGAASTWTVTKGSTLTDSPSIPASASVITSVFGGIGSTWTVIEGSTIIRTPSMATLAPSPTGETTVISSFIDGIASTWTVIGGSTVFGSSNSNTATPTVTGAATVITSVIDGVGSTWTIIGGSTIFGTLTQNSTSTTIPTGSLITLTSTGVNGNASIQTLTSSATIINAANDTMTKILTTPIASGTVSSSATISSSATSTSGYISAFTGISIVVAQNASICYTLPTPTASLHESLLNNTGRIPPYIDAFYLNETTNSVKYLRLMDNDTQPVLIDVSDPARLAIVDKTGDVLLIDSQGLHFTSANCSPKIDIFVSGFFEQLNNLTNSTCGNNTNIPVNGTESHFSSSTSEIDKRQERTFDVVLHLKDQCGNPARADIPVSVALGDTQCVVLPGVPGDFVANCAFPGGQSDSMVCETNVINLNELLKPFVNAGLDIDTNLGQGIISVIDNFLGLYDLSTSTFKNSTSEGGSGQMSAIHYMDQNG